MRNLVTLCATVALLGTANPSAAGEHPIGVTPESMDALSNIFDVPEYSQQPIVTIDVNREDPETKERSVQSFVVDAKALSDDDCLSVYKEKNTYVEGSYFKYVWCQESDYAPDVPALRRLQFDVYFYGSNFGYLRRDNLACEVSDIVPLGAYNKLCIDYRIPPK